MCIRDSHHDAPGRLWASVCLKGVRNGICDESESIHLMVIKWHEKEKEDFVASLYLISKIRNIIANLSQISLELL